MQNVCKKCGKSANLLSWQTKCYSCQVQEHKERLCEEIKETGETQCESEVYCPWCAERYEPDGDSEIYSEGEHELICDSCEKKFLVVVEINYTYDTKRERTNKHG